MKSLSLGVAAATVTVIAGLGGYWGQADGTSLARSTGPVVVDGAAVTGRIETRDDGVYGMIEWTNRTDQVVEGTLVHAAFMTQGASMFSRMMPRPKLIHTATNQFVLGGGEGAVWEFLIQPAVVSEVESETVVVTPPVQVKGSQTSPPVWSLVISREAVTTPVWGGMLPRAKTDTMLGATGQLILAHSGEPAAGEKAVPAPLKAD
jgi:hypothetical protein